MMGRSYVPCIVVAQDDSVWLLDLCDPLRDQLYHLRSSLSTPPDLDTHASLAYCQDMHQDYF